MAQEEIRPQGPWQAERENPDRGEPHAGVIVQIARCYEFACPVVEAFYSGAARFGIGQCVSVVKSLPIRVAPGQIARPDLRAHFQPAFPIGAPQHFLYEFFGRGQAMASQNFGHGLLLGEEPVTEIGREL